MSHKECQSFAFTDYYYYYYCCCCYYYFHHHHLILLIFIIIIIISRYDAHEKAVGQMAMEMGFHQVSLSSSVMPMIRIVPRGYTGKIWVLSVVLLFHHSFIHSFIHSFSQSVSQSVSLSWLVAKGTVKCKWGDGNIEQAAP